MDDALCHVTEPAALAQEHLSGKPFLHCCTEAQLPFVLAQHFTGRTGLVVLRFGPAAIDGAIRWETSEPGMDPFPHLYGALLVAATRRTPAPGAWGAPAA